LAPSDRSSGDADGFEEFYEAAYGRLVGQLYLIVGELHEAEDVVQEALTRAALRWHKLSAYEAPETWVRRVAINLAKDGFRQTRRRLAMMARLDRRTETVVQPTATGNLAVAEALASLPRPQREVVVLHHLLDLSVDEVADQLAIPAGTVKSRLKRARDSLAMRLERERERERECERGEDVAPWTS
jgi:RNA polymerase sigma-70 factor (ECF subfamily)